MSKEQKQWGLDTQAGRWQYLLNGGKLKRDSYIVYLDSDGRVRDARGNYCWDLFLNDFIPYEEPKSKKTVYEVMTYAQGIPIINGVLREQKEIDDSKGKLIKTGRSFEVDCE